MKQIDHLYSRSLFNYPSLYHHEEFSETRFRILDQNLNTIGSGVRNFSTMFHRAKIHYSELRENYTIITNPYWLGSNYKSFEKVTKTELQTIWVKNSELETYLNEMIVFDEIEEPEPKWEIYKEHIKYGRSPYPNFKKEYSIIYKANDIHICSKDTLKEFIWFYQECIKFFNSDNVVTYSSHPDYKNNRNEWINILKAKTPEQINNDWNYKTDTIITFNGDYNSFIDANWNRTLNGYLKFCSDTINHLENLISSR